MTCGRFLALAIAAFLLTSPAIGQPEASAPPAHVNVSAAPPTRPAASPLSEVERQNLEMRIEDRVKEQTTNLFEILASISIGLFGILITTVVIFFALRTKDSAVAEARKGIEEFRGNAEGIVRSLRTEFELAKNELERILNDATVSARAIQNMQVESQAWAANIAQRLAAQQSLSSAEQLTLDLRSNRAEQKTADEFSAEDYLLLIAKHIEQKNWELARELAGSMRLVASNAELQSAGYFYEGTALFRLGRVDEAMAILGQAIEKFGASETVEVRRQVAKCRNNMIVALMRSGRYAEAIDQIRTGVECLVHLPVEQANDLRRKLFINKGNALSRLGRNVEAAAVYDEVILELCSDQTEAGKSRLAHALYNKACAYAQMGKVNETVAHLERSREIAVTADTENISSDSDFDPIRSKPTFQRFLARHGLQSESAPGDVRRAAQAPAPELRADLRADVTT